MRKTQMKKGPFFPVMFCECGPQHFYPLYIDLWLSKLNCIWNAYKTMQQHNLHAHIWCGRRDSNVSNILFWWNQMQNFIHSSMFGWEKAKWGSQVQPYQKWIIRLWQPGRMCAICHMASSRRRGGGRRCCGNNLYIPVELENILTMAVHFFLRYCHVSSKANKQELTPEYD